MSTPYLTVTGRNDSKDGNSLRVGATLYNNRVYKQWYTRYSPILTEEDRVDTQPFIEIERNDEEIAMRAIYGSKYTKSNFELNNDKVRSAALVQFHKLREKRERRALKEQSLQLQMLRADREESPTVDSILLARKLRNPEAHLGKTRFTKKELDIMRSVLDFWQKLRARTKRKEIMRKKHHRGWRLANSRWRCLQTAKAKTFFKKRYQALHSNEIRQLFSKAIRLVCCVIRFLNICSQLAGHAKELFKVKDPNTDEFGNKIEGKFIFDPSKFKISTSTVLDQDAMFSLTKPFFNRSEEEIRSIMKSLQVLRCFAELPVSTQRIVAAVSWFIKIEENKIIIRQCQEAKNCYILLSGKVVKNVYEGNPFVYKPSDERGGFKTIRSYTKDSIFGEEALTKPGSIRDYSVIAGLVDCEALSISVDDYFQACMTPKEERQNAPEHIKFISNCAFLRSFPKIKLIEEAEENIYMAYFSPKTVVEQSVKESDWVYVVKHGTCRGLVELKPLPRVVAKYEQDKIRKAAKSFLAPSIADSVTDLDILKSDQADRVESSYTMTDVQRQQAIAEILEKDMPVLDHTITEETRLVKKKLGDLSRRLTNFRKKEQEAKLAAIHSEAQTSPYALSHRGTAGSISPYPKKDSIMSSKAEHRPSKGRLSFDIPSKPQFRERSRSSLDTAPIPMKKQLSFACVVSEDEEDDDSHEEMKRKPSRRHDSVLLSGTQITIASAAKVAHLTDSRCSMDMETPDTPRSPSTHDAKVRIKDSRSRSRQQSEMNIPFRKRQSSMRSYSVSQHRKSKHVPFCVKGKKLTDEGDPAQRRWSNWKLKKTLVKGDQIGFEWIDLLDGSYRPPDEEQSLVSDGAELVMIRKTFLFKYLGVNKDDIVANQNTEDSEDEEDSDDTE